MPWSFHLLYEGEIKSMTVLNLTKKAISQSTTAVLALIASVVATSSAQAAELDFSGTFQQDNDAALFNFTVEQDSEVTLFSSSWLYRDPPQGQEIGGFDPVLALWDSTGNLIEQQDDGRNVGSTVSNGVSYNYGVYDSYFTRSLTPGSYIASIVQYSNFAVGTNLSQGFRYDSNPNFNSGFGNRSADWEFHIVNINETTIDIEEYFDSEPVPEPASMLGILAFGALGGKKLLKRKQQKQA